jgi:hypothetical protein
MSRTRVWLAFVLIPALFLAFATTRVLAAPALAVLGKDFTFPNKIEGLPSKLSDFHVCDERR